MAVFTKLNTKKRILLLLLIAFGVRAVIFFFVHPYEGVFQIPFSELEPYQDFKLLYMKEVERFLNGSLPYRDFFHAYPPLFLYTLSIFAFFDLPLWVSALPIVVYDALAIIPVFLIMKRLLDERRAFFISVVASLTPMVIFYNSVLWLNPPPSTFFMLLSAYFMLRGNVKLSSLALALATGYKQTSVVLFPAMLIGAYRFGSRRKAIEFLLIFASVCFVVSLPYIVEFPLIYLWSIGVPGIPRPEMYGPPSEEWKYDISQPINFLTYFGVFGFTSLAVMLKSWLWLAFGAAYGLLMGNMLSRKGLSDADFVAYLLYSILIFDTLFPRGIYKYFLNSALPFLAILLCTRKHVLMFIGYGLMVLAIPRFLTPWLTLLLITLLPYLQYGRRRFLYLKGEPLVKEGPTGPGL